MSLGPLHITDAISFIFFFASSQETKTTRRSSSSSPSRIVPPPVTELFGLNGNGGVGKSGPGYCGEESRRGRTGRRLTSHWRGKRPRAASPQRAGVASHPPATTATPPPELSFGRFHARNTIAKMHTERLNVSYRLENGVPCNIAWTSTSPDGQRITFLLFPIAREFIHFGRWTQTRGWI